MNKMGIMGRIPFHPVFNQDKINWKPIAWKERQNMSIKVEFSLSVIFCRINNTVLHRKISWTNGLFPMLWVEKLGITLHNSGHSIKATLIALQLWHCSVLARCQFLLPSYGWTLATICPTDLFLVQWLGSSLAWLARGRNICCSTVTLPELLCAAVSLFDQGRGTLPLFRYSANSAGAEHYFANYNSKLWIVLPALWSVGREWNFTAVAWQTGVIL